MSINNPYVVINSLTATIIKHENTIEDLNASIKRHSGSRGLSEKYSALSDDYDKIVKQLADCKEALQNRPKYEQPLVEEQAQYIASAKTRIQKLEIDLEKEKAASALLRSFFINKHKVLIAELAQYVVDKSVDSDRLISYAAGVRALSPIEVNVKDAFVVKQVQDAIGQLQRLDAQQNAKSEGE